jgi:hypothetical protein
MSAKSSVPSSFNPKNANNNTDADRRPAWNKLRVDPGDGSPVEDYRIENGHVEMRVLDFGLNSDRRQWRRLTREQLISHVMSNTLLAQWLQRRMGVHLLIRACAPPAPSEQVERHSSAGSRAA